MGSTNVGNEIAVVVGATGSFGKTIVSRLSKAGLQIIAVARTAKALDELANEYPCVTPCVTDIADDSSIADIEALIRRTVRMVVHGPGVPVAGDILTAPTALLSGAVNIKVGGMLRLVRAVDAHLTKGSRLVAIGGHYGFEPSAYAASAGIANAALVNASRQLSLAYGPRGITSHIIAPGPADTDRLRRLVKDQAELLNITVEEVLANIKAESSIGSFTTAEQVAWAIAMLLDPEADAMTGSTLMLDSGRRRGLP